jgi:hypothetical protein
MLAVLAGKLDGIDLAKAVRRWLKMPSEDQGLVTILGRKTFSGSEIGELQKA